MKSFANYIKNKIIIEARRGHNPKSSYLLDEEDLDFLYQMDQSLWKAALYQRYNLAWKLLKDRQEKRNKVARRIIKSLRDQLADKELKSLTEEDFLNTVYQEAKKYDDYGDPNNGDNEKPKLKEWFDKGFKKYNLNIIVSNINRIKSNGKELDVFPIERISALRDFIYYITEGIIPYVKENEFYSIKRKRIKFYLNRLISKLETNIGEDSGIRTKLENLSKAYGKKDDESIYFDATGKYGFDLSHPVRKKTVNSQGKSSYEYRTSGFSFPSSNTVGAQLSNLYSLNYHRHFGDLPSDKEDHDVVHKVVSSGVKGGSIKDEKIYGNIQISISNEIKRFIIKNKNISWGSPQMSDLFAGSPINPEKEKSMMRSGEWLWKQGYYNEGKLKIILKQEWEEQWENVKEQNNIDKLPHYESELGETILEWICEWPRIANNIKLRNIFAEYFAKERAAKILSDGLLFTPQILDDRVSDFKSAKTDEEKKKILLSQYEKIDPESRKLIKDQLSSFSYFECPKCGKKWICPDNQKSLKGVKQQDCPCNPVRRKKEICTGIEDSGCGQEVVCQSPLQMFLITGRIPYRVVKEKDRRGKEKKSLKIGNKDPFIVLPFKKNQDGSSAPLINRSSMLRIDKFSEEEEEIEKYKEELISKIKEKGLSPEDFNLDEIESLDSLKKIFEKDEKSLSKIKIIIRELKKEKLTTSRSSVIRTSSGEEKPIERYVKLAGKGHGKQGVRTAGFRPMMRGRQPGNLLRRKDRLALVKIFPFGEQGESPNNSKFITSGGTTLINDRFWDYYSEEDIKQIKARYEQPAKRPMMLVNAFVVKQSSQKDGGLSSRSKHKNQDQKDTFDILINDKRKEKGFAITGYDDILYAMKSCLVKRTGHPCGEIDDQDIHDCANNPSILQNIHDKIVEEIVKNQILNDRLWMTKSRRSVIAGWVGSFLQKSSDRREIKTGTAKVDSRKERTGYRVVGGGSIEEVTYKINNVKLLRLPPQGATWANDDFTYITEIFMTEESSIFLKDKNGKVRKYPKNIVSNKMFKQNLVDRSYLLSGLELYLDDIENKKEDIIAKLSEENTNMIEANNRVFKYLTNLFSRESISVIIQDQEIEISNFIESLNLLKDKFEYTIKSIYDDAKERVRISDDDIEKRKRVLEKIINVGSKNIAIIHNNISDVVYREGEPFIDEYAETMKRAKKILNSVSSAIATNARRVENNDAKKNTIIWGIYLNKVLECIDNQELLKSLSSHIGVGRFGGELGDIVRAIGLNLSEYEKLPLQEILSVDEISVKRILDKLKNHYNRIIVSFNSLKSQKTN